MTETGKCCEFSIPIAPSGWKSQFPGLGIESIEQDAEVPGTASLTGHDMTRYSGTVQSL